MVTHGVYKKSFLTLCGVAYLETTNLPVAVVDIEFDYTAITCDKCLEENLRSVRVMMSRKAA